MSLPLEDRRDIYKRIGPQQRTKNSTTQDKCQHDSMQIRVKTREINTQMLTYDSSDPNKPPSILKCIKRQVQQNGERIIEHRETQILKLLSIRQSTMTMICIQRQHLSIKNG